MPAELAELDRRMAEDVGPERRAELAAVGRSMTPRAVQALTHPTLAGRLDS